MGVLRGALYRCDNVKFQLATGCAKGIALVMFCSPQISVAPLSRHKCNGYPWHGESRHFDYARWFLFFGRKRLSCREIGCHRDEGRGLWLMFETAVIGIHLLGLASGQGWTKQSTLDWNRANIKKTARQIRRPLVKVNIQNHG
jgi:hypothetical protein